MRPRKDIRYQTDPKVKAENAWYRFIRAFEHKFDPDQPRDEFGRWTNRPSTNETPLSDSTDFSAIRRGQSESVCWAQYTIDLLRCGSELRPAAREICRGQAMERYAACRSGRSIPPLSF